jgi:2-phosphosulfolactate phosphatase
MCQVSVHLLPRTEPVDFGPATVVIIDVLRASTTIVTALAHGARAVIPVEDVATARKLAHEMNGAGVLLGGERGGELIEGFDLDNSPCNYTRQMVDGKHVIFTTSHGTRAIAWSAAAPRVLIASFANLSSVVRSLANTGDDVHLVCSGTDHHPSIEDSLCASEIAGRIWQRTGTPTWRDDTALMLLELYHRGVGRDESERLSLLASGRGGQRLTRLGMDRDIAYAARMDRFDMVPWLHKGRTPPHIVALPD